MTKSHDFYEDFDPSHACWRANYIIVYV